MAEESIQERQENELEALKAIYGDQLHENSSRAGTEWQPLDLVLSLVPQQGSVLEEAHALVDLHIVCSKEYPNEIPHIAIIKSKGLTTQQVETLLCNLNLQAESLRGEVMVFELASMAKNYLHQYNRPGFQSLYDEMFTRQLKKQQQEEERKKVLEDKTRQEVLLEIHNKKEALKQEMRWRKNSDVSKVEDLDYFTSPERIQEATIPKKSLFTADIFESEESNDVKNTGVEEFTPWSVSPKGISRLENEFEVLKFVGSGAFGEVLQVRNKLDRCLYAIKRIELNTMNKLLYKKITREVKLLSRLNHENVVRYYNSWIETTDSPSLSAVSEKSADLGCQAAEMLPINEISVNWENNSESSEDSSEDNCWITFLTASSEDKSSMRASKDVEEEMDSSNLTSSKTDSIICPTQQFMYIQMEFCEKSTLRNAIDSGLYQDEKRVLRLLREVVEGLSHIHQQGIIHRDLKPVNVFIDSEDHVKIGDFGLATTNILQKTGIGTDQIDMPNNRSLVDASHTGQVGTALYVAPELNISSPKASYNQKVDIYSLGVMFFEMCYRPLNTSMERMKVLADIRLEECVLPVDFEDNSNLSKTQLLRWMLTHDPVQRPSSSDLLQSELLPPPQFEECELQELLRRTLNNPQSKLYKYLIASCLKQKMTTAQDVTYDMSMSKGRWFTIILQDVVEKLTKLLKIHGAVNMSPPLLVPCSVSSPPSSAVAVMTRWGGVALLPYDLRLPFARFLAHNPSITQLKRYAIDKVYRERRVLGHHPRELYECAFDIVTPVAGNVTAESELIAFIWQVLNEFPSLMQNNCIIRINHTSLLQAIFLHCGIESSKHNEVCRLLVQVKDENCKKTQIETLLSSLNLADHTVSSLFNLLDQDNTVGRAYGVLQPILRRNSVTNTLCKQAFSHLEKIVDNASELGVKCPVVVSPGLVENLSQYSGLICQVQWEQKNKQGYNQHSIIAAGGRYDNLINSFRIDSQHGGSQSAVGLSISIDKLVATLQMTQLSPVDCVVCSVGTDSMTREKLGLARDLWATGIKTYLLDSVQNLEEVQNICLEMKVPHIIMLKNTDPGYVRIRSWNKDRFQEKKVLMTECVELLCRLCQTAGETLKHEIKSVSASEAPVINVVFLSTDKLSSVMKRRYESQVLTSIQTTVQRLSARVRVEVIVVGMERDVVKTLACYIEVDSAEQDLSTVIKKFPKHKKTINRLMEQIQDIKNHNSITTIILYSLIDSMFKVLL